MLVQPVKLIELAWPAHPAEPAELVEPAEPAQPAELAEPAELAQLAQLVQPGNFKFEMVSGIREGHGRSQGRRGWVHHISNYQMMIISRCLYCLCKDCWLLRNPAEPAELAQMAQMVTVWA